jgi:hypothetical protein
MRRREGREDSLGKGCRRFDVRSARGQTSRSRDRGASPVACPRIARRGGRVRAPAKMSRPDGSTAFRQSVVTRLHTRARRPSRMQPSSSQVLPRRARRDTSMSSQTASTEIRSKALSKTFKGWESVNALRASGTTSCRLRIVGGHTTRWLEAQAAHYERERLPHCVGPADFR